jgi:hypothetical protein
LQAVVAIDTLYFTQLDETVRQIRSILTSEGRLIAYYSYALHDHPEAGPESLDADHTPLAEALRGHGFEFGSWDFTEADYQQAQLRKQVLADFEAAFAAEGNLFLYDNRLSEANGIARDIEADTHRRYLYRAGVAATS